MNTHREELTRRLAEVDAEVQAKLKPEDYEKLTELMSKQSLIYFVLPLLLGADLWAKFWPAYSDKIAADAQVFFEKSSEGEDRRPSLFGV